MKRQLVMWAFICTAASVVCAHDTTYTDSTYIDTTVNYPRPLQLDEVVIKATPTTNKADKKIIRPATEILKTTTDGLDLLRRLQLPRISVNPLTNEIHAIGGGDVILCINGVEVTNAQISAIRPQDILRIEYHDTPDIRHTGAAVTIDYITSRHRSGGNIQLESFDAIAGGRWATIDHLAGQYNRGRAVWNINVGYMGQQKDKWTRDYDETWHYPDATVTRNETGLPVTVGHSGMESVVNYNYLGLGGDMFNARVLLDFHDVPNMEEGDRRAILHTSESEASTLVTEHTEERYTKPGIGLYYRRKVWGNKMLFLDAQGSYMRSHMYHEYSENGTGEHSRVVGNRYAVKLFGMLENRHENRIWRVGIHSSGTTTDNTYRQTEAVKVRNFRTETALSGEYANQFGNMGITGSLRLAYRHIGQSGCDIDRLFLLPALNVSYKPSGKWFVRYAVSLDYTMPSAAETSDVEQTIQIGMTRRGNIGLRPFKVIDQSLTSSFESQYADFETRLEYRYEHNPIMESVIYENGGFVRTYFNQQSFRRLIVGASLRIHPWENHLSVSVSPLLTRYFSHGNDYHHCQNIFRIGFGADFNYGNWLVSGNTISGPANIMYGEEIIEEKDMNTVMVGYKRSAWSIHLGIFNAFMKNYWMKTCNMSALTPYTSNAHSGRNSSYLVIKVNFALNFGRKNRYVEIPETDTDNDTGILTGTK